MPQDFLDLCGSHVQVAATVEETDFVLWHGSKVWHRGSGGGGLSSVPLGSFTKDGSFTAVDEILQQCLSRQLPLLCANPDFPSKVQVVRWNKCDHACSQPPR